MQASEMSFHREVYFPINEPDACLYLSSEYISEGCNGSIMRQGVSWWKLATLASGSIMRQGVSWWKLATPASGSIMRQGVSWWKLATPASGSFWINDDTAITRFVPRNEIRRICQHILVAHQTQITKPVQRFTTVDLCTGSNVKQLGSVANGQGRKAILQPETTGSWWRSLSSVSTGTRMMTPTRQSPFVQLPSRRWCMERCCRPGSMQSLNRLYELLSLELTEHVLLKDVIRLCRLWKPFEDSNVIYDVITLWNARAQWPTWRAGQNFKDL